MKRLLITLSLSLLAVTAVVLWRGWPHLFPSSEVSDLYRRYEHHDHIRATAIHDFQSHDTLAVETVLLQATTDSAWYALLTDFGMPEELIEMYKSNRDFLVGDRNKSLLKFFIDKNNIRKTLPLSNPDSRMVIGSLKKRSLCVFITDDNNLKNKISYITIKDLKNGH
jgi:hypothetical protein